MKITRRLPVSVLLAAVIVTILALGFSWYISAISPVVMPGSTGSYVEKLQQTLKNQGYLMDQVDGKYDLRTMKAVKTFQYYYGLKPTGIADKYTLFSMGLVSIPTAGGSSGGAGVGTDQLLARAINGEARGEPYEGQVAVGAVIINRTRHPEFPKTVPGVIYQPGAFTAVSDGQINVPMESGSNVLKAARDALNGWDPTNGCIYYWNPATATSKWIWSRQVVKVIGKHYFGK